MIFNKNDLINKILDKHFDSWMHTLNTADFVQTKYLKYIDRVIFENLKKKFKEADIYELLFLELIGYKLSFWQKLKISFSGLRPLFESELKQEQQVAVKQKQVQSINPE